MRRIISSLLLASLASTAAAADPGPLPVYSWTTFAGRASLGREDGVITEARFNQPSGLARLGGGSLIVADRGNHTIRSVSPGGVVSTVAGAAGSPGSTNGPNAAARFNGPRGVGIDGGYNIYVTDTGNCVIRRIAQAGGVSTYAGQLGQHGTADGPAATALFDSLDQIAVDLNGNVYVADHGIRKIAGGMVTTVFSSAQLTGSGGQTYTVTAGTSLAVDSAGVVYFSATVSPYDGPGLCIVKLDAGGNASFVSGPENFGYELYGPNVTEIGPLAFDNTGQLYFAERWHYYYGYEEFLVRLTPAGISTVTNINSSSRWPDEPRGLAFDANGWILTRASDSAILGQNSPGGIYAGTARVLHGIDGSGPAARFANINGLAFGPAGNLWATDTEEMRFYDNHGGAGSTVRKITPAGETSTTHSDSPTYEPATYPNGIAADGAGNVYYGLYYYYLELRRQAPDGTTTRLTDSTNTAHIWGYMTANSAGTLVLAELLGRLEQWTPTSGFTPLAGVLRDYSTPLGPITDGTGAAARFGQFRGLTTDRAGDFYILDAIPGPDGIGGVCYIRKVTTAGVVTTLSRNLVIQSGLAAPNAELLPYELALDSHGTFFVVYPDNTIRQVAGTTGDPVVIGGVPGQNGSLDGNGAQALFNSPYSIVIDDADNLYVADASGQTIRKGQYLGTTPTVLAHPLSQSVTVGGSITIGVTASATPAPTYQWFHNGVPIIGATGPALTVSNFHILDVGDYAVNVTNPFGTVTSDRAMLTLSAPPAPPSLPASSSGGGGAVSPLFLAALLMLGLGRWFARK